MEDKSCIQKITYSDFTDFHQKIKDNKIPGCGSFEVTTQCNLRCVHCYVTTPDKIIHNELTFQEICRILDQIAEKGCLFLLLTGGEPLGRVDFPDIYAYALKKGFIITLFTNGTLIDETVADAFLKWPPYKIEITLYGATKETYESVTRVPGSFQRCMRGIHLLHERRIPLEFKTMVMTINHHEVHQMEEIAESMGAKIRLDPVINPHIDGNKSPLKLRLPPEDAVQVMLEDPRNFEEWVEYGRNYYGTSRSENLFICSAGVNSFHIDSCGRLQLCLTARHPSYNLRQGSFSEGWNGFLSHVRNQKRTKDSMCIDCDLIALCDTCPGTAEMEHGDKELPVDYYCRLAHLRAEKLSLIERHEPHGICKGGVGSAIAPSVGLETIMVES